LGEIRCTTIVMSGELLTVVTPSRRTSSGSRGSACDTLFCTSCCALSGSVPSLNVTVSVSMPSVVAWLPMYSMPSTPLIDSSSGMATVSAITLGLAPGYWARTTTAGGTTSGYSDTGRARRESRPASRISSDSTPAKMGRSMKNLDRFMAALRS
jgi:hypothetical protein